jgi:hypothetical protein
VVQRGGRDPFLWTALGATTLVLAAAYLIKAPCLGMTWDGSQYATRCFNDFQVIYHWRGLDQGVIPYVEGFIEYPPVTGLFIYAASWLGGDVAGAFHWNAFGLAVAALSTTWLLLLILRWDGHDQRRVLLWAVGSPLLLYAFHNWDVLSVILAVAGWWAWRRQMPVLAGVLFATGAMAKVWPGLFLPFLLIEALRGDMRQAPRTFAASGWSKAVRLSAGAAGALAAWNLPFLLTNSAVYLETYTWNLGRGPTVESFWYAARVATAKLGLPGAALFSESGAPWTSLTLLALGLAGLAFATWMRRVTACEASFGAVALMLLANQVMSVQYVLWLLPFLVLLPRIPLALAFSLFAVDFAVHWTIFDYFQQVGTANQGDYFARVGVATTLRTLVFAACVALVGVWATGTGPRIRRGFQALGASLGLRKAAAATADGQAHHDSPQGFASAPATPQGAASKRRATVDAGPDATEASDDSKGEPAGGAKVESNQAPVMLRLALNVRGGRLRIPPAALYAVLALAALLHFGHGLDIPQQATAQEAAQYPGLQPSPLYWDEQFYMVIAHKQAAGEWIDPCWSDRPMGWDHPPVAKLLMTLSVRLLDIPKVFSGCYKIYDPTPREDCYTDESGRVHNSSQACFHAFMGDLRDHGNAWAWRLPSALLATMAVLFAALAARRLFDNDLAGLLAGGLLMVDGLVYTMGRAAMLDIFAAGFLAVALYAATFATWQGRLGAGAFLGLAFASKYTAFFAGPAVLLVALWAHARARSATPRNLAWTTASVVLVPAVVWVLSYTPWWILWIRDHGVTWAIGQWVAMQSDAYDWQAKGLIEHPYVSQARDWLRIERPVWLFGAGGRVIYAIPNPVLYWGALVAGTGVVSHWAWRLARQAAEREEGQAVAPVAETRPRTEGTPLLREDVPAHQAMQPDPLAPERAEAARAEASAQSQAPAAMHARAQQAPASPLSQAPATAKKTRRPLTAALRRLAIRLRPQDPALFVAVLLPMLPMAAFLLLERNSFNYYLVALAPFFAVALAGAFTRLPPLGLTWLGAGLFLILFVPLLLSFSMPELAPGARYVIAMAWAGTAALAAMAGWAFGRPRMGRIAGAALLALLALAAFLHYFPILEGLPGAPRDEILRLLPWTRS